VEPVGSWTREALQLDDPIQQTRGSCGWMTKDRATSKIERADAPPGMDRVIVVAMDSGNGDTDRSADLPAP